MGRIDVESRKVEFTQIVLFENDDEAAATSTDSKNIPTEEEKNVLTEISNSGGSGVPIAARQADCSVSLPNNTGVAGYVAVTTAGSGAALGDLLVDDGTGVGVMTISPVVDGRSLSVTVNLTGGTIELAENTLYLWDAVSSSWIASGGGGGGDIGLPWFCIPAGETVTVPSNRQHTVHGNQVIEGQFIINGEAMVV